MHYDYLIVGSGLFGATFARYAADSGKTCLVIDKRPNIAGNVYTKNVEGINVHVYGAHIFHTSDDGVWEFVNRFAKFNGYVNRVIADFKGERYSLPFNMYTFEKLWGVTDPEAAKAKIAEQIAGFGIGEITNLEQQAISMVGVDVYRKLVKGYTEKQWGRPCTELPPSIIKRQGNAVVNYTSYDVPYTRIIEHKYFEGSPSEKTVISREYPDTYEEGKEAYYTVNDEKNNALAAEYKALAAKERPDIIFGGRLGEYKYYDMDKVIASARELAKKELGICV